ncbi:MAG: FG-GAP repeat domain-containing protein [Actinomycetales bacterium]
MPRPWGHARSIRRARRADRAPRQSRRRCAALLAVAILAALTPLSVTASPAGATTAAAEDLRFTPAAFTSTGQFGAASLDAHGTAVADLDGDGHLDVALIAPWMGLSAVVMYGTGTGRFDEVRTHRVGAVNNNVVAAEVTGDDRVDLIVTTAGSVLVLRNEGSRHFVLTHRYLLWQNPFQGSSIAGDFDSDGDTDLAVKAVNGIRMLVGDGRGEFTVGPLTTIPGAAPGEIAMIDRADLDGDGIADLVAGLAVTQRVVALRGTGEGAFTVASTARVPFLPTTVKAADLDGNGTDDLVVLPEAAPSRRSAAVLLTDGAGRLGEPVYYSGGFANPNGTLADFDGDGRMDVASVNTFTGDVVFLAGNGDGTLRPAGRSATEVNAQTPVAGDFTEDGRIDLAVPSACPGLFGSARVCLAMLVNDGA